MKHRTIILTSIAVLLTLLLMRQCSISRHIVTKNVALTVKIDSLQKERDALYISGLNLDWQIAKLKVETLKKDSLFKASLLKNTALTAENKRLRDSLLNVSDDTIIARMDSIRPNIERLPPIYGISGPQARFWYTFYIESSFNVTIATSLKNSLNSCVDINGNYVQQIGLFEQRLGNANSNLNLANNQIGLYRESLNNLTNSNKKLKKINYFCAGAGFLFALLIR